MDKEELTYEELKEYYDRTVGLWAIDRDPKEVDLEWIKKNAFQLEIGNNTLVERYLKPFNLEKAKNGKNVYTRDGRKARVVCFDRKGYELYPMLALVETDGKESLMYSYKEDGMWSNTGEESRNDLMMLPETHEAWIVVCESGGTYSVRVFLDERKAKSLKGSEDVKLIKRITWSE